jgi:type I restriction-modification system DNA methylase subunit
VLENDLVEGIIGLPTDIFYNTGILARRRSRGSTA